MKTNSSKSKTSSPNASDQRHEVFLTLIAALARAHLPLVAERAGVSYPTLWKWLYGDVVHPHSRTLFAVADALGFTITLTRRRGAPRLTLIK